MAKTSHIRNREPEAEAAKAFAEEVRIRQERHKGAATGSLGRSYDERKEKLEELRARQKQVRLDQREAMEKMFGEMDPKELAD